MDAVFGKFCRLLLHGIQGTLIVAKNGEIMDEESLGNFLSFVFHLCFFSKSTSEFLFTESQPS